MAARCWFDNIIKGRQAKRFDGDGEVAAHYEYSPFGSLTKTTGAYAASNPFRFSSEYFDEETGLVYYNYRYYNPELGKCFSRAPQKQGQLECKKIFYWDHFKYLQCSHVDIVSTGNIRAEKLRQGDKRCWRSYCWYHNAVTPFIPVRSINGNVISQVGYKQHSSPPPKWSLFFWTRFPSSEHGKRAEHIRPENEPDSWK